MRARARAREMHTARGRARESFVPLRDFSRCAGGRAMRVFEFEGDFSLDGAGVSGFFVFFFWAGERERKL